MNKRQRLIAGIFVPILTFLVSFIVIDRVGAESYFLEAEFVVILFIGLFEYWLWRDPDKKNKREKNK